MSKRLLLASLAMLGLTLVMVSIADEPTKPAPQTGGVKIDKDKLTLEEQMLKRWFSEFEQDLLKLKQRYERSAKPEERDRAVIIQRALDRIRDVGVGVQFEQLVEFLKKEEKLTGVPAIKKAMEDSRKLAEDLREILALLREDSRASRLREERIELEKIIRDIEKAIHQQKIVRGLTEQDKTDRKELGNAQAKVTDQTARILDKLGGKIGGEAQPNKGEVKGLGKGGDKSGEAKDAGKSGKDAAGESKEGKQGEGAGKQAEAKGGQDGQGGQQGGKEGQPSESKSGGKEGQGQQGKSKDGQSGQQGEAKGGQGNDQQGQAGAKGGQGNDQQGQAGAKGGGKEGQGSESKGSGKEAQGSQGGQSGSQGKDGQAGNQGAAKGGDKNGQQGGAKSSGDKGSQAGAKPGGNKGSQSGSKSGEAGSKSGSKSGGEAGSKSSGSKGSQGSKGGQSGSKSGGEGGQSGKQGQAKSGSQSQGQSGSKSSGQSGSQGGQQGGQQGQAKDDSGGDKKGGNKQGGNQDPQDPTHAKKRVQDANEYQKKAEEKIEQGKNPDAGKDQDEAINKLNEAKKKLEELLRQLREEELERLLAALQARCERMLAMQIRVYDGTVALHKAIEASASKKADRNQEQQSLKLSDDEKEIVLEATKAIEMLEAEGSAVAFPEVFTQVREDMRHVQRRLGSVDPGKVTIAIEEDIIATLKEMIEALKKAKQDLEQSKNPPKPSNSPPPPPQDQKLLDQIAELKMIRSMQIRVNERTRLYGRQYEGEQASDPNLRRELRNLSERQERIFEVTNRIAKGDNK